MPSYVNSRSLRILSIAPSSLPSPTISFSPMLVLLQAQGLRPPVYYRLSVSGESGYINIMLGHGGLLVIDMS